MLSSMFRSTWLLLAFVAIVQAWSIDNGAIAVSRRGDTGDQVSFANAGVVELGKGQTLDVTFEIQPADFKAHQAVLMLSGAEGPEYVSIVKQRGKSAKAVVPHSAIPEGLKGRTLDATLVVASFEGESSGGEPFQEVVFQVSVENDAKDAAKSSVPSFSALPEIWHQFAPPPRPVSLVVALVFVGATIALTLALFGSWASFAGIKLGAPAFVGVLTAIELVFFGYFIQLSIFSTMAYTAFLLPFAFLTGQAILKNEHK